ncbi:MAG: nitronate monooxygenase [Alphaproteobacteria bacterium]|nr:nitronate monooxygenase [Alphaproteobacteria bacterium]
MKNLKPIMISGKEVLPIIEGGKGINATNGFCSGSWAKENCVGTFSAITPDSYDENNNVILERFLTRTRPERQQEMIEQAIRGCISQAQIAYETSNGNGRIHMNMLWESGGAEKILNNVLEKAKGLINGVTCGAGLPYKLGEIASKFGVYYYPIISSARAFQVLWKRSFNNFKDLLGGVVYEDPWLAGGHNGLSNAEDPNKPEAPYNRLVELRKKMNEYGLYNVPIILAGGVWSLSEWDDYIDNPDIGQIAFQFGTRPLLTKESPISEAWKKLLTTIKKGDVIRQSFSPTGFVSMAVKNTFLERLMARKDGEIVVSKEQTEDFSQALQTKTSTLYIKAEDVEKANRQLAAGFTEIKITPDSSVVFLTPEEAAKQQKDRAECVGCLSQCMFSSWCQRNGSSGRIPDPRSYCIHKTLYDVGHNGSIDNNLVFAGSQAYRFGQDPFYNNGFVPTVKELVQRITKGE